MELKQIVKKNYFLRKQVKKLKIKLETKKDAKLFVNNYIENSNSINHCEYNILLLVHSLEKGFCYKNQRMFGKEKIKQLIAYLNQYYLFDDKMSSTPCQMGLSMIKQWVDLFQKNGWDKVDEFNLAMDCLEKYKKFICNDINVGSFNYTKEIYEKYNDFDYLDAIRTRYSSRVFQRKEIENDDLVYCIQSAIESPSACNRQMIKLYYIEDKEKRESLKKLIMGLSGFDKDTVNLFIVTFDISAFSFARERNQGYLNAGLFAMNFVNALHFRGIGSCFLQWANKNSEEEYIKKVIGIPDSERIAIVIGAGYYKDGELSPISIRKNINEVYKKI